MGPPLGDRADTYLENTIHNRTIPCAVFQLTALANDLALVWGIQVWALFPLWVNAGLMGMLAVFSWRSYGSGMRFGWF